MLRVIMSSTNEHTTELITSELLHNRNCFNYLRTLKLPNLVLDNLSDSLSEKMHSLRDKTKDDYDPSIPYADLYTEFFDFIEENIRLIYLEDRSKLVLDQERIKNYQETLKSSEPSLMSSFLKRYINSLGYLPEIKKIQAVQATADTPEITFEQSLDLKVARIQQEVDALDGFILSLYDNDNYILEDTFDAVKDIVLSHAPVSKAIEGSIASHLSDKGDRINLQAQSPAQAGSKYGRFAAMMSDNFKPQHTTSLSTVRHYQYNEHEPVREYRFGTQGQRHEGVARVSPLFEQFLEVQALKVQDDSKITHIYFNNLARDRHDAEGLKEKALTLQLEGLEATHSNVAVITLPADKGLMDKNSHLKTTPEYELQEVKKEFLQIAMESPEASREIKDFHISKSIRGKIFCDANGRYTPEIEQAKLAELIDKSIHALGFDQSAQLSSAQRQAVWFHFLKFELTNHIITALKPEGINFSCKDAIDRGGVSSAYYNLVKSFEPGKIPMDREEFERALHAAPSMVKARGMNHHINVIWNAVNAYVNQNDETLSNDPGKTWLCEWRDLNCPHELVQDLLTQRVGQFKDKLNQALEESIDPSQTSTIKSGLAILNEIEKQSLSEVSGKRLLLETAVRTTAMALDPKAQSEASVARYRELTKELSINYPKLQILCGLMKTIVGAVLAVVSFGKATGVYSAGLATMKAGIEVGSRREMITHQKEMIDQQHDMKAQLAEFKGSAVRAVDKEDVVPDSGLTL